MEISLHDNWIYAHQVDHDSGMIFLRTVFPHVEPPEFTDVIFEGVLVHHFQNQCMGLGSPYPSNVLFDIEEAEALTTLGLYRDFIQSQKNHGWPASGWNTLEELALILTKEGHRCFHIHGTVGLDGFVFAKRMRIEARASRWMMEREQDGRLAS